MNFKELPYREIDESYEGTGHKEKPEYLSEGQWKFCEYYLQDGQMKSAAIRAGYAEKRASSAAYNLMRSPKVRRYLEERKAELEAAKVLNTTELMSFLSRVVKGEEKDQFDLDVSISDRLKAADMLLKRMLDQTSQASNVVTIINDIPRPENAQDSNMQGNNADNIVEDNGTYEETDGGD